MFLILLETLKRFNYTINIHNSKKFINALLHAFKEQQIYEVEKIKKEFEKIDEKIIEENQKRLEDSDNEFDR